jgi:hypothetical protein
MKGFGMGLVVLAAVSGTGCGSPETPPHCSIAVGELVPTAEAARQIAEAIITSKERPEYRSRYLLRVQPAQDNPAKWLALQELRGPDGKELRNIRGGGGLGMLIDRCTAEASEVYYQR